MAAFLVLEADTCSTGGGFKPITSLASWRETVKTPKYALDSSTNYDSGECNLYDLGHNLGHKLVFWSFSLAAQCRF